MLDYRIFENMQEDKYPGESEQEKMERVFRTVTAEIEESLRPGQPEPKLNERMEPVFQSCNSTARELTLDYQVRRWMLNPGDKVHGGILTTACDLTMGMLTRYCWKCQSLVTAQLSMSFMRNIGEGGTFRVCAHVEKAGRRTVFTRAEVTDAADGKLLAEATALFM